MTDETTTEQLAEIEGQATEYTPPEGWRVVRFGEQLLPGDVWVNQDGTERRSAILHWDAAAVSGGRCIRRIEPDPQPQPQPEPVQVREGQWRTRGGDIRNVTPTPEGDRRKELYPWWDAQLLGTWTANGRYYSDLEDSPLDLIRYLGPIEQQPEAEPEPDTELQAQVAFLKGREVTLGTRLQQEKEVTTRLRGELESVQRLLGTEKRRVTQLEELVGSLRTINDAQEKAFERATKGNDRLALQLEAVKAELVTQAETSRRLQIELDAAHQVPADSPELRQLRADLEQVTQERDQYLDSYQRIFGDLETIRETTKAAVVEAIAEWLQPIRAVDNEHLANETLQHLPQIMRHLTGLDSPEDVD